MRGRDEVTIKSVVQDVTGDVPQLVAELTIANNTFDIEIDVSA